MKHYDPNRVHAGALGVVRANGRPGYIAILDKNGGYSGSYTPEFPMNKLDMAGTNGRKALIDKDPKYAEDIVNVGDAHGYAQAQFLFLDREGNPDKKATQSFINNLTKP